MSYTTKIECKFCKKLFTPNNINRHELVCTKIEARNSEKATLECKFCKKISKDLRSSASHQYKCPKNINRKYINGKIGTPAWNKGLSKNTNHIVAELAKTIKQQFDCGIRKPAGCFAWNKDQRSKHAKDQNFGGYRKNAGRSKKYEVVDSFGNRVVLQSSYELSCSKILDDLGIKWIRPKFLLYDNKKYFADFYLPEFNIYLDPKNNYKAQLDKQKIELAASQNNVKIFVLTFNQLNEDYIKEICNIGRVTQW